MIVTKQKILQFGGSILAQLSIPFSRCFFIKSKIKPELAPFLSWIFHLIHLNIFVVVLFWGKIDTIIH